MISIGIVTYPYHCVMVTHSTPKRRGRALANLMRGKLLLCSVLFSAGATASSFLLGVGYSEWLTSTPVVQIATDSSGALYMLSGSASSTVTKLAVDGKTIVWQNQLAFLAGQMAVDPSGGVYVVPQIARDTAVSLAKLGANGNGLAWTIPVGFTALVQPVLAVDSQGRAYVAAFNGVNGFLTVGYVARVNAAGTAVDYTAQVNGQPYSIAVDQTGAAYIAGTETNAQGVGGGFLARLAPDGSAGYYSILASGVSQTVAADANGNVVVFGPYVMTRVDATGAVTLSIETASFAGPVALDAAGNVYLGAIWNGIVPVKNSLAPCADADADCDRSGRFRAPDHIPSGRRSSGRVSDGGCGAELRLRGGNRRPVLHAFASWSVSGGNVRRKFPDEFFAESRRANLSSGVYRQCGEPGSGWGGSGRTGGVIWKRARAAAGGRDASHWDDALPDIGGRCSSDLRRAAGAAAMGAGRADQRGGALVVDAWVEHAGLRQLQQCQDELPALAGGPDVAGGIYSGWRARGGAESGRDGQLGPESGAGWVDCLGVCEWAGSDQSSAGRRNAGGHASATEHADGGGAGESYRRNYGSASGEYSVRGELSGSRAWHGGGDQPDQLSGELRVV